MGPVLKSSWGSLRPSWRRLARLGSSSGCSSSSFLTLSSVVAWLECRCSSRTPAAPAAPSRSDMVLSFEVAAPRSELYSGLLALSKVPAARGIYRQHDLRRHVVSFLWRQRFHTLPEAVAAVLCAGRAVRVVRNATLPSTRCVIPPGGSVTIASRGGPRRLRHLGGTTTPLFAICNGGVLSVSGLRFEALRPSWRRPVPGGLGYFATVLPDGDRAGRLEIADDVTFHGYAEIVHRATGPFERQGFERAP